MIIPLRDALLRRFSNLPAGFGSPKGLSAWAHRADTLAAAWRGAATSLPIWSCSVWGLPCRDHYWARGALLPHLFTLTPGRVHGRLRGHQPEAVCSLLHLPSRGLETSVPDVIRHTALRDRKSVV